MIAAFMQAFGSAIRAYTSVYFSGGATAVLYNIRSSTIDIDLFFEPDNTECYQVLRRLKDTLNINLEIAAPHHFVPVLPGWRERSEFIEQIGSVSFYHYDLVSQIISKIQRGYEQDMSDATGFVTLIPKQVKMLELMESVKEEYLRFPTVEFQELKFKVEHFLNEHGSHPT